MELTEHIDIRGHLNVPVKRWLDPAPKRAGWTPFFVNVDLKRDPVKIVIYRRDHTHTENCAYCASLEYAGNERHMA